MNTELLKASFIMIAAGGLILFHFGTKNNMKKIFKYFSKPKTKKEFF